MENVCFCPFRSEFWIFFFLQKQMDSFFMTGKDNMKRDVWRLYVNRWWTEWNWVEKKSLGNSSLVYFCLPHADKANTDIHEHSRPIHTRTHTYIHLESLSVWIFWEKFSRCSRLFTLSMKWIVRLSQQMKTIDNLIKFHLP